MNTDRLSYLRSPATGAGLEVVDRTDSCRLSTKSAQQFSDQATRRRPTARETHERRLSARRRPRASIPDAPATGQNDCFISGTKTPARLGTSSRQDSPTSLCNRDFSVASGAGLNLLRHRRFALHILLGAYPFTVHRHGHLGRRDVTRRPRTEEARRRRKRLRAPSAGSGGITGQAASHHRPAGGRVAVAFYAMSFRRLRRQMLPSEHCPSPPAGCSLDSPDRSPRAKVGGLLRRL